MFQVKEITKHTFINTFYEYFEFITPDVVSSFFVKLYKHVVRVSSEDSVLSPSLEVLPDTDGSEIPLLEPEPCINCNSAVHAEKLLWNPTLIVILIFIIFAIGLYGFVFNRSHILLTIISGEVMLLAAYINFVHAAYAQGDPKGNIYALLILVIAAAESAIGLALIIRIHRLRKTASLSSLRFLRG